MEEKLQKPGMTERWRAALLWALAVVPLSAQSPAPAAAPATRYGHRAYPEAPESTLRPVGEYRDTGRIVRLRGPAAVAFEKMRAAAQQDGVGLVPISGFRSRDYQSTVFERTVRQRGSEERAARWVAPPGYSEHHTGLAIDIGDARRGQCDLQLCFERTKAYHWLVEHAGGFGFELSFPRGSRQPNYEPWHWRFVGDEASRRVFE